MSEMDTNDLISCLSSDEDIDKISINDKNVEILGYVDTVNAPQTVGKVKTYDVLKFIISNKKNRRVQCSVWDGDIPVVQSKIKAGSVIHINGAWSCEANPQFNRGNVKFELSIKSATIIEILQEICAFDDMGIDPTDIKIDDIELWVGQCVVFKAYLKSPFQLITMRSVASYGCASVCKGVAVQEGKVDRVEVRVSQFSQNVNFSVGDYLELKGCPKEETDKYNDSRIYFEVQSVDDIKKIPGEKRKSLDMIKCVKTPKRARRDENERAANDEKENETANKAVAELKNEKRDKKAKTE